MGDSAGNIRRADGRLKTRRALGDSKVSRECRHHFSSPPSLAHSSRQLDRPATAPTINFFRPWQSAKNTMYIPIIICKKFASLTMQYVCFQISKDSPSRGRAKPQNPSGKITSTLTAAAVRSVSVDHAPYTLRKTNGFDTWKNFTDISICKKELILDKTCPLSGGRRTV